MELVSALGQYSDNEDDDDEDEHNFNLDKMELCDGKEDGCKDGLGGDGESTAVHVCTESTTLLHKSPITGMCGMQDEPAAMATRSFPQTRSLKPFHPCSLTRALQRSSKRSLFFFGIVDVSICVCVSLSLTMSFFCVPGTRS